jgi:hypothetical protein
MTILNHHSTDPLIINRLTVARTAEPVGSRVLFTMKP